MSAATDAAVRVQLAAELARIRSVRELLEARARVRQPRASYEEVEALLQMIANHVPTPFHADDVLTADAPRLRAALSERRLDTKRRLGALFRDLHRRPIGRFRITQCGRDRDGCSWSIHAV